MAQLAGDTERNQPANQVSMSGSITGLDVLRHTPGGVAMVRFTLTHESTQQEAGAARKVGCEVEAVATERDARLVAGMQLGSRVTVQGFLDRKSLTSAKLVLHATRIEFNG